MGSVITVTSAKGGAGKTTLCCGIGAAFSLKGQKTILIEMASGLRTMDIMLGLTDSTSHDIFDVSTDTESDIADIAIECDGYENLYYIPAPYLPTTKTSAVKFHEIISVLKQSFDYIIIDIPFFAGKLFKTVMDLSDTALIVSTPDLISARSIAGIKDTITCNDKRLIINRVGMGDMKQSGLCDLDELMDITGLPLISVLLEEKAVTNSANNGTSTTGGFFARQEYNNIAARLCGEDVLLSVL